MLRCRRLDTIFWSGEGRTVVVALDGCAACCDAFDEFLTRERLEEDRIVVVLEAPPKERPSSHSSNKPVDVSKADISSRAIIGLLDEDEAFAQISQLRDLSGCVVPNTVVVPDRPLKDFANWDKRTFATLTKLVQIARPLKVRFEAFRLFKDPTQRTFADSIIDFCDNVDADLLVIAEHKPRKVFGRSSRQHSLCQEVLGGGPCPVVKLGGGMPVSASKSGPMETWSGVLLPKPDKKVLGKSSTFDYSKDEECANESRASINTKTSFGLFKRIRS